jgi:hypothetical protein
MPFKFKTTLLMIFVLVVARPSTFQGQGTTPPALATFDQRDFTFLDEFYGGLAYTDPAAANNLLNTMANGVTLWPPIDSGMTTFLSNRKARFMHDLYGATKVDGTAASSIESKRQALATVCQSLGPAAVGWNLMIEWDQGGGHWVPQGRPRYTGLSRPQAYSSFTDYYLNNSPPLGTYLREPRGQRACPLIAQTDYPANVAYAYEMGADVALLERSIDELSDVSTGIAFVRGSSRQYDRRWGIDISTWRTSNNKATEFDNNGVLLGGWSPSYLRRHLYVSYMSGAHIINIEPTRYYYSDGRVNPFGQMTKDFGDFALRRHTDVGRPVVPMAVMLNFSHGFDPKHWLYNQYDAVWYGDIPYSTGDFMINNFMNVAYPGHSQHGLTPGAPFLNTSGTPDATKFQQYLSSGGDPRPYEPMGSTRWGDNNDVILSNASLTTLRQYKVIALLGDLVIDTNLASALQTWVQEGGVLVANTKQVTAATEGLFGVTRTQTTRTATTSTWLEDNTNYTEPAFEYQVVTPGSASVLARSGQDAVITSNSVGLGRAVLTTPSYLQSTDKSRLLTIGTRLLDSLHSSYLPARVSGPPIEYIVNQAPGKVIVMLVNNTGTTWNGSVVATAQGPVTAVREYLSDTNATYSTSGSAVTVSAQVAPYDVRAYAVEFNQTSTPPPAAPTNLRILQ